MTILVGMRCVDGVVIGTDGSATFAIPSGPATVEQPTSQKLSIHGKKVIVAGSGPVGLLQRYRGVVGDMWAQKKLSGADVQTVGNELSAGGQKEFARTGIENPNIELSALVALPVNHRPVLYELPGNRQYFQPEVKEESDLWYVSMGSGQPIVDPFLGFLRTVFWSGGSPPLREGVVMTLCALEHACEVNPGGIKKPISIAVLEQIKKDYEARKYSEDELEEAREFLDGLRNAMIEYRDQFMSEGQGPKIPP